MEDFLLKLADYIFDEKRADKVCLILMEIIAILLIFIIFFK